MALKINEDIKNSINNSKFDEDDKTNEVIKEILIAALELEFKRYKEDIGLYSDEYDKILKEYLR